MPEHALRELNAARPVSEDSDWFRLRGDALRQSGEFDEAVRAFRSALNVKPDDPETLTGMAWCYKRTGQVFEAIEAAETAYRNDPDEAIRLYRVACYHAVAGNREQSLSWLGRALRMDPDLCRLVDKEPDFNALRDDQAFEFIVRAAEREE